MDLPDGNWWVSTHSVVYNLDKKKGIKCYVDTNFQAFGIKKIPTMLKM